ncbi:Mechanosensitive ion channel-domain-containing protein [Scenedesmus sp. NREL 46B-D3]|nr:Mechanosensitive ion channel-domain-containing protein [Scenedesmus sp. NREL 46B-D3]
MRAAGPAAAAVQAYKPGCLSVPRCPITSHRRHLYPPTTILENCSVAGNSSSSSWHSSRPRWAAAGKVGAAKPTTVLEHQPMLSTLVTGTTSGLWETLAWQATLDVLLPVLGLLALYRLIDLAAERSRRTLQQRVADSSSNGGGSNAGIATALRRRSTLAALVLLAVRAPAMFVLPPLCCAYVLRSCLHMTDLVLHQYRPHLPRAFGVLAGQVSGQLVPLDSALQTLLQMALAVFGTWFLVQLKNILVRDLLLPDAVRSGHTELERIYLPLSSLLTWAAGLGCALAVCGSLGLRLEPLLAVGGAGGIAAGFASQQVLTNMVSGVNIFLSRPFVVGDQVKFAGGSDLEGTVESVEIMRTLLRTTGGTLVAIPNKTVAELIVYNRTRSLAAAAAATAAAAEPADTAAAAIAAVAVPVVAAPLRRVLCFGIQLSRDCDQRLDEVRTDVRSLLNRITMKQLVDLGLAVYSADQLEKLAADAGPAGDAAAAGITEDTATAEAVPPQPGVKAGGTPEAAAAAEPKAAPAGAAETADQPEQQEQQQQDDTQQSPVDGMMKVVLAGITGSVDTDDAEGAASDAEQQQLLPDVEPLPVSISLAKLAEDGLKLFVRCELMLPGSTAEESVEQQTEEVLIGVSSLVREKYQGIVLWC